MWFSHKNYDRRQILCQKLKPSPLRKYSKLKLVYFDRKKQSLITCYLGQKSKSHNVVTKMENSFLTINKKISFKKMISNGKHCLIED